MPSDKTPKSGRRQLHTKVKTAKGRKLSSTQWLQRQLNDPYVASAKADGYRSRAAYKILETNEKFQFFKKGKIVIDLGAAPGGWLQVAAKKVKAGEKGGGIVIGIDLQEIDPLPNATLLHCDFLSDEALIQLDKALQGKKADVVLSDMAAPASGTPQVDHLRIMSLCEAALEFALDNLAENGVFVAKILQGGTEMELLKYMRQHFTKVKHFKPPASRPDSAEMYVVAIGFKAKK